MPAHARQLHWLLVVTLALVGCDRGRERTEPDGHAHEEEEKTRQITVWGERFEVFLEHGPIVVGVPVKFVTHVTEIATGEARRSGRVTFRLRLGSGESFEHVVDEPARPGIYLPEIAFPVAGDWLVALTIPVDGGASEVDLGVFPAYATARAAKEAKVPEAPEGITFLKEQQWRIRTRIDLAGKRRLVERLRLPGTVKERPGFRALVTPPVTGRLLAPAGRPMPKVGDRVRAGQVLAIVQPPFSEFAARLVESEAEVLRTKAALELAEVELERNTKLHARGAVPESEVQRADSALRSARASHDAAVAIRKAYRGTGAVFVHDGCGCPAPDCAGVPATELKAPIDGVITHVGAALGEVVFTAEGAVSTGRADQGVFEILDPSVVLLEGRLHEADLRRLGSGLQAAYEIPGDPAGVYPIGDGDQGGPVFIGFEVDPTTRTIPLIYEAPNADGRLRVGMTTILHVQTARAEEAVAIPLSALVEEEAGPTAYVQIGGETFEKRHLTLGIRDGGWVQVLSGIEAGERVVIEGAFAIRLASVSGAIPAHGHAH